MKLVWRFNLDLHDGFKQSWFRFREILSEAISGTDLESHFRGVNIVETTILQVDRVTGYWVLRDGALVEHRGKALVHRRDILLWDASLNN